MFPLANKEVTPLKSNNIRLSTVYQCRGARISTHVVGFVTPVSMTLAQVKKWRKKEVIRAFVVLL